MEVQRTLTASLVDRLTSWYLNFPQESCTYTITPVRIPVLSGIDQFELAADLYKPVGVKPLGTLLARGPYGRSLPLSAFISRPFAARGYQVLFVSCRGTFGSGGDFDPFKNEEIDGQAVVAWMREQPWYTGTFATLGMSYLGFTQWALLRDPPKDLVASVIHVAPHDFAQHFWGTGSFTMDMIGWADMVVHQETRSFVATLMAIRRVPHKAVLDSIPLLKGAKEYFTNGKEASWLEGTLRHPDPDDEYYASMNCSEALEKLDLPIFLVGGWYDLFVSKTVEQYIILKERGVNVAMTMGPWPHNGAFDGTSMRQTFDWITTHLAKEKGAEREKPVHYYITGAEQWRYVDNWPPASEPYTLYMQYGGGLTKDALESEGQDACSQFTFDPKDPTPTIGGNLLGGGAGKQDDSALAAKKDVLTFTTELLTEDLDFAGTPKVSVSYSSASPVVDFFVRISDVDAKGRSYNITEAFKRFQTKAQKDNREEEVEQVELELNPHAHRFLKGHRIRFYIAGGSHAQHLRNSGTEENLVTASETHPVHYSIYHANPNSTRVTLPVVPST